jgi:AcrR family transcriptional regulator
MDKNRKSRYTKTILRDSLIEVIQAKPVYRLTVKDICEKADLSRSTFYAYYKDQFDLLAEIEEEFMGFLDNEITKFESLTDSRNMFPLMKELLEWIADSKNTTQVLLSENGDIAFQKKFFGRVTTARNNPPQVLTAGIEEQKLKQYSLDFIISGTVALVQGWLRNNMDIPIDEFAGLILKLWRVSE